MTLDERLRAELRHTVEANELREEEAFDSVQLQHGSGLVRKGVVRQATTAAIVLSLFAGVGIFASWRSAPDRYRSTATVRVAAAAGSSPVSPYVRPRTLSDPRQLALAGSTRRAVLLAAHLSSDDTRVEFRATLNARRDLLSLAATAPSANESTAITREWISVLAKVRRADAIRRLRAEDLALNRRVTALHRELLEVDAQLKKIDPIFYRNLRYNPPYSYPMGSLKPGPTNVRAQATVEELNLWNERGQILAALTDDGAEASRNRIETLGPEVFTAPVARTPAIRVDEFAPAMVPVVAAWAVSLALALAGAVFVYRRQTRGTPQVSA